MPEAQYAGRFGKRLELDARYYERSLYHFEKGRYDQAIADLDEALAHDPDNAEYLAARGLMLALDKQYDAAAEDFEEALAQDVTQWIVYYGQGIAAFDQNDFAEAIDQFSRAQQLAPERPEIYYYRAVTLYLNGDAGEARHDMTVAQSLLDDDDKRQRVVKRWLNLFKP
jgi:tetratricopeptide (TPR) repeat protein